MMEQAYGAERARAILGEVRHNTVYYPSLTIKGAIQAIRVVRPLAVDRTLIESWTFRLAGAPAELLQRTTHVLAPHQRADLGGRARRPALLPRASRTGCTRAATTG